MCARLLFAVSAGLGVFVGTWIVAMTTLTGPRYVPATWITLLAAGAGLLAAGLTLVLASLPRGEAQEPQAKPARQARRLTDAHVALAMADPPAPPPPTRPQPPTLPEDNAPAWLRMDSRRKVWPKSDRPATPAVRCLVRGKPAWKYVSEDGSEHVFMDVAR